MLQETSLPRFFSKWSEHPRHPGQSINNENKILLLLTCTVLLFIRVVKTVIIAVTNPSLGYATLIVTCEVPGIGASLHRRLCAGICLTSLVVRLYQPLSIRATAFCLQTTQHSASTSSRPLQSIILICICLIDGCLSGEKSRDSVTWKARHDLQRLKVPLQKQCYIAR